MSGVGEIAKILMRRDGMTREEAIAMVQDIMPIVIEHIQEGDYQEAEEIFTSEFGLEPDYLMNLML